MKRHELDVVSLVAGLLFLVVGIVTLADIYGEVDVANWWVGPAALMAIGIAGIASVGVAIRRSSQRPGQGGEAAERSPSGHDPLEGGNP